MPDAPHPAPDRQQRPPVPPIVVVMGVSGSGKTTVAGMLAGRLGWPYADADDFHSAANVAKMAAGVPLTDEDRWAWLVAIAAWIDEQAVARRDGVVTCSALKRSYRDMLREGRPQVRIVYLDGSRDLIMRRLLTRHGHFMKADMLDSQFATLEPPTPDEEVIDVSIDATPAAIVDAIIAGLRLPASPGPARRSTVTPPES